eukprot:scaffold3266_cov236-Ochromonas_danica.AAC.2
MNNNNNRRVITTNNGHHYQGSGGSGSGNNWRITLQGKVFTTWKKIFQHHQAIIKINKILHYHQMKHAFHYWPGRNQSILVSRLAKHNQDKYHRKVMEKKIAWNNPILNYQDLFQLNAYDDYCYYHHTTAANANATATVPDDLSDSSVRVVEGVRGGQRESLSSPLQTRRQQLRGSEKTITTTTERRRRSQPYTNNTNNSSYHSSSSDNNILLSPTTSLLLAKNNKSSAAAPSASHGVNSGNNTNTTTTTAAAGIAAMKKTNNTKQQQQKPVLLSKDKIQLIFV